MTRDVSRFLAPDFLSLTIGIVVYFVGVLTTQRVKLLRDFSIPEPVSGGGYCGRRHFVDLRCFQSRD